MDLETILKTTGVMVGGAGIGGIVHAWVMRKGDKANVQIRHIEALQKEVAQLWDETRKGRKDEADCLGRIARLTIEHAELKREMLLFQTLLDVREKRNDTTGKRPDSGEADEQTQRRTVGGGG